MRVPGGIIGPTMEGSCYLVEQIFEPCSSSHAIGYPYLEPSYQCEECSYASFGWDCMVKHTKRCLASENTAVVCTKLNNND